MANEALLNAFRFNRAYAGSRRTWYRAASMALEMARRDMAAGKARYSSSPWGRAARPLNSSPDSDGCTYVESPEACGLRLQLEAGDLKGVDHNGWFTNPYGESFKDGSGLCYGAVFLMTGRDGRARAVAGYQHGGQPGYCVDFKRIFDSIGDDLDSALYEASRAADGLAESAAEDEREYQTAWQAGSQYGDLLEKVKEKRRDLLELLKTRKSSGMARKSLVNIVSEMLSEICEMRKEMTDLREGDKPQLCFYTGDERLRDAFCEGASLETFPGLA